MTLPTLAAAAALLLLGGILWFLWKLVRSPLPLQMQEALEKKEQQKLLALKEEWSKRLSEEIKNVWQQMQGQVQTTEKSVSQKLQQANDTVAGLTRELGKLQEATKKVEEVGRGVVSFQDLLRSPKMRGGFGEFFLADLLSQILPADFYSLQYEFSDGERVDAVIRLREKLVPVDSKFPLDQFRRMGEAATDEERAEWRRLLLRDVRQHIDSIAQKYIRPSEGTFDFALMYIPAENVYYETVIKDDGTSDERGVFLHAVKRQVIPVSPNSFYAYLQVILQGLRGLSVEQRSKEILGVLIKLQKELVAVREDFDKAGKQLGFAVENFEKAEKHLGRFEDRLTSIETPIESAKKPPVLEQPSEKEVRSVS
ncbi:MAG: DNA recombination protein RmuC [Candidatus Omnitrophica bacterium]|nr:DNA recombination protein RmuC [Candidatus Omnitrophota bacterium]